MPSARLLNLGLSVRKKSPKPVLSCFDYGIIAAERLRIPKRPLSEMVSPILKVEVLEKGEEASKSKFCSDDSGFDIHDAFLVDLDSNLKLPEHERINKHFLE